MTASRLVVLSISATLLAACGASGGPSSGCLTTTCAAGPSPLVSPAPGAALTATDHGWTTSVAIHAAPRSIDVTVTVPGPISVDGGCVPSLTAWAVGENNTRVEVSPSPALHCGALSTRAIIAGQTADFTAAIPLPTPGTYAVHGLLRTHLPVGAGMRVSENLPVVTITVP